MADSAPFWKTKSLAEMSREEWESAVAALTPQDAPIAVAVDEEEEELLRAATA